MLIDPIRALGTRVVLGSRAEEDDGGLTALPPITRYTIEDALVATGWVVLIIAAAILLAAVAAIWTIAAGKPPRILVPVLSFFPWIACVGMLLQLIRMGVVTVVGWRDQNGPRPGHVAHWLLTVHDSDLIVQVLVAAGIVVLEIQTGF